MDFRQLHPEFGAEVLGFDVEQNGTREEIHTLRSAFDRYGLLLFRCRGRLEPQRQVTIASWFGPPPPVANDAAGSLVSELRNEESAGRIPLPFHSDLTYTEVPIKAICLHALAVPRRGTSTSFISSAAAWDRLPPSLQEEVGNKSLRHVYESRITELNFPRFVAEHPVRFSHPRTGRPILLVTQNHAERISQLDEDRSRDILGQLFTHLYAPIAQYRHWWRLHDLLIWDNLLLQHARLDEAIPSDGPRVLQRVALSEVGFQTLLQHAHAAAART